MARRSLRPELNRIRAWARQGRTDAWIAHQLEVTVQQIESFKREHGLDDGTEPESAVGTPAPDFDDEIDLRAEDDALIAAELEAAEARKADEPEPDEAAPEEENGAEAGTKRRRGRRGGGGGGAARRGGRRKAGGPLEATFDHGDEGYGLWLDPAVQEDPIYAENWAGHRSVEVTIEEDQIVIRRTGEEDAEEE